VALASGPFALVVADQAMHPLSGLQLLDWTSRYFPQAVGMLLTGPAGVAAASRAVGRGDIFAYAPLPPREDKMRTTLACAAREARRRRRQRWLARRLRRLGNSGRSRFEQTAILEQAVQVLSRSVSELERACCRLRQRALHFERHALTDFLTGLPNRRAIEQEAEREVLRLRREPGRLAIGLVDVDDFKAVNTQFLHSGGDRVLVCLAAALAGSMRSGADRVGRLGGEEFLVVAPQTDADGARTLAERLRNAVEKTPARHHGRAIPVTVSLGFAVAGEGARADYGALLEVAAAALAEAKASGRNRAVVRVVGAPDAAVLKPPADGV
jgi:diguanylate cyclase (GGDEF)-like protein